MNIDSRKFLGNQQTKAKKKAFLEAWERTFCSVTKSCDVVGISRQTVYNWKEKDPYFLELYEFGEIRPVDLAFSKLIKAVGNDEAWAIKHMLENNGHKIKYGVVGTTGGESGQEMPIKEVVVVKTQNDNDS